MKWSAADYRFMSRALQLANHGRYTTHPNPRVGCVIVSAEKIITEAWHSYAGGPHAEVAAIEQIKQDLTAAHAYVTLEPCNHQGKTPPCSEALITAGIQTVTVAMTDPNPLVSGQGIARLQQAGIDSRSGLLAQQAAALNPGFIKRMEQGMPYVRCKQAISIDGKIALSNGVSQWISSEHSRQDVQRLRGQSSAILTSVDTVLADNPRLTVRSIPQLRQQPLRVIVDSNLRIPPDAQILSEPGEVILFTVKPKKYSPGDYQQGNCQVVVQTTEQNQVDLTMMLLWLAEHKEVNELLVEAGSRLCGALIAEQLVDELVIYQANRILGHEGQSMLNLADVVRMQDTVELQCVDHRLLGTNERKIYKLVSSGKA